MSQLSLKLKKLYEEKKYKEIINIINELDDINLNSGLLNLLGVCKMQHNNSAETLKSAIQDFRKAYLREKKINFYYSGYDINKNLIKHCIKNYPETFFKVSYFPTELTDITIASGTYNYTATDNIKIWEEYIIFNLKKCMAKSKLGLIFNLQFTKKESFIKNLLTMISYPKI